MKYMVGFVSLEQYQADPNTTPKLIDFYENVVNDEEAYLLLKHRVDGVYVHRYGVGNYSLHPAPTLQ